MPDIRDQFVDAARVKEPWSVIPVEPIERVADAASAVDANAGAGSCENHDREDGFAVLFLDVCRVVRAALELVRHRGLVLEFDAHLLRRARPGDENVRRMAQHCPIGQPVGDGAFGFGDAAGVAKPAVEAASISRLEAPLPFPA